MLVSVEGCWLHRNLSSHQVVFFHDKGTGGLRLDEPYLIGFQYSRPDDNLRGKGDHFGTSEGIDRNKNLPELYLPPELSKKKQRRYRRSDDVYSMGIILFEAALWEPVQVFYEDGNTAWDVAEKIVETAEIELASETGELYRDAVLSCIRGLRKEEKPPTSDSDTDSNEYDGKYRGEDPEYGLEVDFLWRVLREIEKCKV